MCRVSFTDTEGMTHSVKVTAASLYEAAVLGLAEFRRCAMIDATPGPATRLTVVVEAPGTAHEFSMQKLKSWLNGNGKSPAEQALKVRLRELLALYKAAARSSR
jgi:hypothetical protein